jgi:hypothetical protein
LSDTNLDLPGNGDSALNIPAFDVQIRDSFAISGAGFKMQRPIAEVHPELFHYTSVSGLRGILESQVLWAIHAAFLNDATELTAFRVQLPDILKPATYEGVGALTNQNPANQALVDREGGLVVVAEKTANDIATGMYNALLGTSDTAPYIEAYITSFCTSNDPRVSEHGLLSQWRAYGKDGGYALVFDAAGLDSLLETEAAKWGGDLYGGDVVYSSDDPDRIREELGDDYDELKKCIAQWLTSGGSPDGLESAYDAVIQCACRFKHWGFSEEREVRLIAIPPNGAAVEHLRMQGKTVPLKPHHSFVRCGASVPCLHLFEGITKLPETPLPIKRIIVGPHRNKNDRRRAVELLVSEHGLSIPVSVSEIPYIGWE